VEGEWIKWEKELGIKIEFERPTTDKISTWRAREKLTNEIYRFSGNFRKVVGERRGWGEYDCIFTKYEEENLYDWNERFAL
jgi:hypothetical protein